MKPIAIAPNLSLFTRLKYALRIYPELPIEQDNWDGPQPPVMGGSMYHHFGVQEHSPVPNEARWKPRFNVRYILSNYFGIRKGVDFSEDPPVYEVWISRPRLLTNDAKNPLT